VEDDNITTEQYAEEVEAIDQYMVQIETALIKIAEVYHQQI